MATAVAAVAVTELSMEAAAAADAMVMEAAVVAAVAAMEATAAQATAAQLATRTEVLMQGAVRLRHIPRHSPLISLSVYCLCLVLGGSVCRSCGTFTARLASTHIE